MLSFFFFFFFFLQKYKKWRLKKCGLQARQKSLRASGSRVRAQPASIPNCNENFILREQMLTKKKTKTRTSHALTVVF